MTKKKTDEQASLNNEKEFSLSPEQIPFVAKYFSV